MSRTHEREKKNGTSGNRAFLTFLRASSHIRVRLGVPLTTSLTFLQGTFPGTGSCNNGERDTMNSHECMEKKPHCESSVPKRNQTIRFASKHGNVATASLASTGNCTTSCKLSGKDRISMRLFAIPICSINVEHPNICFRFLSHFEPTTPLVHILAETLQIGLPMLLLLLLSVHLRFHPRNKKKETLSMLACLMM